MCIIYIYIYICVCEYISLDPWRGGAPVAETQPFRSLRRPLLSTVLLSTAAELNHLHHASMSNTRMRRCAL